MGGWCLAVVEGRFLVIHEKSRAAAPWLLRAAQVHPAQLKGRLARHAIASQEYAGRAMIDQVLLTDRVRSSQDTRQTEAPGSHEVARLL